MQVQEPLLDRYFLPTCSTTYSISAQSLILSPPLETPQGAERKGKGWKHLRSHEIHILKPIHLLPRFRHIFSHLRIHLHTSHQFRHGEHHQSREDHHEDHGILEHSQYVHSHWFRVIFFPSQWTEEEWVGQGGGRACRVWLARWVVSLHVDLIG